MLICRFIAVDGPRLEGRYSGVFFDEVMGVPNCFVVVLVLGSAAAGRLTLVKPELTAVKPPELMAVNPVLTGCGGGGCASSVGVSRSELTEACSALDACRAGESPRRLDGVLTLECFIGLGAGLGVNGPPFSHSNCWWTPGFASFRKSSYGQSHFWYEFFSEVDKELMILPLYPRSRPISAHFFDLQTLSKPPRDSTAFLRRYRSRGRLSTYGIRLRWLPFCL